MIIVNRLDDNSKHVKP